MKRVIIESPYAGGLHHKLAKLGDKIEMNLIYLRDCMRDCLLQGEAPFASHGLYTQPGVLDDTRPEERALGIAAGFAWRPAAELTVFYVDLGWSPGMHLAVDHLKVSGLPYQERQLGGKWAAYASLPDHGY